jgi:hypothetical protein
VVRLTAWWAPLRERAGIPGQLRMPAPGRQARLPPRARAAAPGRAGRATAGAGGRRVADAVVALLHDDALAGWVPVFGGGKPRRLLPVIDWHPV